MARFTLIHLCSAFIVLLTHSHAYGQQGNVPQPQVTLEQGTLRGFYQRSYGGREIASFQSIPYVKQPMGRHRFKDAVEMSPWLGVYDATGQPPDCSQYRPTVSGFSPVIGSEDCLYINVYTPFVPSGTEMRPLLDVLVYIHGGAFMYYGSGHMTPKYLLDKDLVLVTFNYRLGPLGFLSTGDATMPGNVGMKDQVRALHWVQRYISSFGGDPNKVTLAGQSSGGAAVQYHLLSPLSNGLFQRAIIGSGSALNPWAKAEKLPEKTMAMASKLGCAFKDIHLLIKCLRSRPANHIAAFTEHLTSWLNMPIAPWAPTVEPVNQLALNPPGSPQPFLEDDPLKIIKSGQAHDVPIMFSYISNECITPSTFFLLDDKFRNELLSKWDELLPHVLDFYFTVNPTNFSLVSQQIKQHYLNGIDVSDKATVSDAINKMMSDRLYISGIAESCMLHAEGATSPVYAVKINYKREQSDSKSECNCYDNFSGGLHYDDSGFILDNSLPPLTAPLDIEVRNRLIDLWYSFITGKPMYGETAVPEVKPGLPSLTYLDIGIDGNPSVLSEGDPGQKAFWNALGIDDSHQQAPVNIHNEL